MFNLCNIFSYKKVHPINSYIIGGVGLAYAWNDDSQSLLT